MDKEYFVNEIKNMKESCFKGVIENFEKPPGRKPSETLKNCSEFYNSLNDDEKNNVSRLLSYSMDKVLFSFLCILDHVRFIEDTEEKSEFELYAIKEGQRVLINDPQQEELHNLYNDLTLDQE